MIERDKLFIGKSVCILDKYFHDKMYLGNVVFIEDNNCGSFAYVHIQEPDSYYPNDKTDPRFPAYYHDIYPIMSNLIYDADEINEYENM